MTINIRDEEKEAHKHKCSNLALAWIKQVHFDLCHLYNIIQSVAQLGKRYLVFKAKNATKNVCMIKPATAMEIYPNLTLVWRFLCWQDTSHLHKWSCLLTSISYCNDDGMKCTDMPSRGWYDVKPGNRQASCTCFILAWSHLHDDGFLW